MGGGSNAMGLFDEFINEDSVRAPAREGQRKPLAFSSLGGQLQPPHQMPHA